MPVNHFNLLLSFGSTVVLARIRRDNTEGLEDVAGVV